MRSITHTSRIPTCRTRTYLTVTGRSSRHTRLSHTRRMAVIGVCEDDDALRGILRAALEREGNEVRVTASGADAVRAFTDEIPDALILDIGLPDADGRDVCQALRARGVIAPVLFLTARDGLQDRLSGFHAGGNDYLGKPFAIAELVVRLDALIRRADQATPSAAPDSRLARLLEPASHS